MFDQNLAIVDLETTGLSGGYDRIIELAIIRVEKNKIVDQYTTLINPETYISPFIENFTGIAKEELLTAPLFADVKNRVIDLLTDAVFVAHNVRFDYTFVKNELKRTGTSFRAKTCCTVKLSRRLFPRYKRHGLESIIERYNFRYKHRHRAYDDAYVLWQFLQKIKRTVPKKKVEEIWKALTKSVYSSDKNLVKQIDNLPESAGIYIFYDKNQTALYVGKSKNIYHRVVSHFTADGRSDKHLAMMKDVAHIDYRQTAGELGALLREAQLVKELQPFYNRVLRKKDLFYTVNKWKNKYGYFEFKLATVDNLDELDFDNLFGNFNSLSQAKDYLTNLTEKYKLCSKLTGVETTKSSCFNYKLGKCNGACIRKESAGKYNNRFLIAYIENKQFRPWPYNGAIEIFEKDEENELYETFTINNWRLNGKPFDLDRYRIFSQYLSKSKTISYIKS